MHFTKEILTRAMSLGMTKLSLSQIAERLKVKRSTLHDWLEKAKLHNLSLQDASQMSEADLREMLFPHGRLPNEYHQPDWTQVVIESKRPKVSKNSLWRRYLGEVPEGAKAMSRSTFLRELEHIEKLLSPEMQHIAIANSYVPARIGMIDYSGNPVHYWCNGKRRKAQLFVAIVPYTSYTFAYATVDQSRESHLTGLKAFFSFLNGVPDEIWCDNTRSLVDKADKTDPIINKEFRNFCDQYDTIPYAVAPGEPTHKAPVENAVNLMQLFVVPELERRRLQSVEEINEQLPALLEEFNAMPFSEMPETSRTKRFLMEEAPLLKDLPLFEYEPGYTVKSLKVSKQNQVRALGRRIPVFYGYIGSTVRAFINEETGHVRVVDTQSGEIIGERHIRKDSGAVLPTTAKEMPESLKRYVESKKELLERILRELGEDAHHLGTLLSKPNNSYSKRYLNALIVESRKFTQEDFSALCREVSRRVPVTFTKFKNAVGDLIKKGKTVNKKAGVESVNTRGADHYRKLVQSQRQTTKQEQDNGAK